MKLEKMTRRSLAMLLVMMMVFSLAVPAFADTGIADGTTVSEEDHNHNNEATSENNPSDEGNGNAADTNDGDAEEHVHSFTAAVDGMCGGPADITYTCSCGDEYVEHIEILPHDEVVIDTLEATCTEGGYTVYHCNHCGAVQTRDEVEALGHDYVAVVTEPTCTMQGYTTYTCSRCSDSYVGDFTENANAHVWNEGTETKAPTCTEAGIMTFVCTVCGETKEEEIPTVAHDWENVYDPENGFTMPTCTEGGCAHSTCKVCGLFEGANLIDPLGHTHEEGAEGIVTAPTCTMQGYTSYVCTRCGDSYQDDYTDMIPHVRNTEMPERVITPAAIGVEGTVEYMCRECGMPFTATIPALRPSGGGGGGGAAAPAPVEIDEPDVPLAAALPFDDVKENSWFREAVQYVYDNDLMSGEEDTVFNPNGATTRGMIVKTLYNMEKEPAVSSAAAVFSDVVSGKWYSDAVSWAAENEIVTGYDDGSFRPENSITRQELAAILYRYAGYKQYDVTGKAELSAYADANAVSDFAKGAVEWSVKADLISGIESDGVTVLAPANGATRAQLATILMRFNQNFAASEGETK